MVEEKKEKKIRWINLNPKYMSICRYAIFVIFAAIIIYILASNWSGTSAAFSRFLNVLSPFLIGVLIAYFLSPLVDRVHGAIMKLTKNRFVVITKVVSIIISYIIVLGFLTIAIVFVVPQVGESIRELTRKLPMMYSQFIKLLEDIEQHFPELGKDIPALDVRELNKQLASAVPNLVGYGTNILANAIPALYSLSMSIVKLLINLLLGIIISVYMIYSKESFAKQAKRLVYAIFDEEKGDVICQTFKECNSIFSAFVISKALDSFIIGCLCFIVMSILHLPYAVLISVIVGITNMIPYFGPFIGAVPGVLIYLCTDFEAAFIFAIMILALQQFDGLILGPRLLGQSTGLSPIWVIFAITVGGAYFGVVGMFIGVPVVAVVAFLCDKFIRGRLEGKNIKALQDCEESLPQEHPAVAKTGIQIPKFDKGEDKHAKEE